MLKYPCLVLDHDDTVVQSEATVNYPFFVEFLKQYRPGMTISLEDYISDCSKMTFIEMCKSRFSLTDEELQQEYLFWKAYLKDHSPDAFPGIRELLHAYRKAGGIICGKMAILAEGDAQERPDLIYLEKLPLFNADGTVKG